MASEQAKLQYFGLKGVVELTRYILALGDESYEDVRVSSEEFKEKRNEITLFGQMPILTVNGERYAQSDAIARYYANKHNLAGSNAEEKLFADMVVDAIRSDVFPLWRKAFMEKDEALKKQYMEEMKAKLESQLAALESLAKGESSFLASGLSWADVCLFNFIFDSCPPVQYSLPESFKKLNAIVNSVKQNPKIAAWIEKRPSSSF